MAINELLQNLPKHVECTWAEYTAITKDANTLYFVSDRNEIYKGAVLYTAQGAYSEVTHGTSDTTFTLTPNTFHVWGTVTSLTLTLGDETTGVANEYLFQFTSGNSATVLSLPTNVKWSSDLVIEPNKIYQISILRGLGTYMSWDV